MYTIAISIILSIVWIVLQLQLRKYLINIRRTVWRMSEDIDQIKQEQPINPNIVEIMLTKRLKRAVKRGDNPTFRLLKEAHGNYILVQE